MYVCGVVYVWYGGGGAGGVVYVWYGGGGGGVIVVVVCVGVSREMLGHQSFKLPFKMRVPYISRRNCHVHFTMCSRNQSRTEPYGLSKCQSIRKKK